MSVFRPTGSRATDQVVDLARTGESGRIRCRCSRFRPSGRISRRTSSIARIRRQTRRLSRKKRPADARPASSETSEIGRASAEVRGRTHGVATRRPIRASPGATPGRRARASLDFPRETPDEFARRGDDAAPAPAPRRYVARAESGSSRGGMRPRLALVGVACMLRLVARGDRPPCLPVNPPPPAPARRAGGSPLQVYSCAVAPRALWTLAADVGIGHAPSPQFGACAKAPTCVAKPSHIVFTR